MRPSRPRSSPVDEAHAAHRAFLGVRFFGALDGLRAASILAVIWFHTVPIPHDRLLGQGNQGVVLFFAISGFLIVTLLLRAKQTPQGISLMNFYGRRALRILPVYYAVLVAYTLLVWKLESDPTARQQFFSHLPAFVSFTANWFVDTGSERVIFYFAWSLAAEEQFYLVWPLVERFAQGARPLALAFAALASIQLLVLAAGASLVRGDLFLRIITSVPAGILLGVCVAHLLHRRRTFCMLWRIAGRRGSAISAAATGVAVLALLPRLGDSADLAVALAFAWLVTTCVIREDNDLAALLRVRWVAWIGIVSYGMYLMHMLGVNVVRRIGALAGIASPYWDFVTGTLAAIALASLSYVTYERFFLRLKDRWFTERRATTARLSTAAVGDGAATPTIAAAPGARMPLQPARSPSS